MKDWHKKIWKHEAYSGLSLAWRRVHVTRTPYYAHVQEDKKYMQYSQVLKF